MIKILVATKETQGKRKNDFSWCNEGELVTFAMECDGETIDGSCGCRRAMAGMVTHTATTTFKVIEAEITKEALLESEMVSIIEGWGDSEGIKALARENAKELLSTADLFEVGTILEKRGNRIIARHNGKGGAK
jgi:hypothetical protein